MVRLGIISVVALSLVGGVWFFTQSAPEDSDARVGSPRGSVSRAEDIVRTREAQGETSGLPQQGSVGSATRTENEAEPETEPEAPPTGDEVYGHRSETNVVQTAGMVELRQHESIAATAQRREAQIAVVEESLSRLNEELAEAHAENLQGRIARLEEAKVRLQARRDLLEQAVDEGR